MAHNRLAQVFLDDAKALREMAEYVSTGFDSAKENKRKFGRAQSAERFAKNIYDYSKSFAEQIDDWKNGIIPRTDTLVVGATPKVFQHIGLTPLPVTINQQHIKYALNGTKNADHIIGETELKQLPTSLNNPIAIIASKDKTKNSLIALLLFKSKNGQQVIVPVKVDGFGVYNKIVIDSNAITSLHGRKNVLNLLTNAINEENKGNTAVYYINKIETVKLFQNSKATMPKIPKTNNGFINSINKTNSHVKPKFNSVIETQQFKRWFGNGKVVDENGKPLVMYHQTGADFTVFDTESKGAARNGGVCEHGI